MTHLLVLSNGSALMLLTCFINELLVEAGADFPPSNVAVRCPAKITSPAILHEEAASMLAISRDRMKGCKKFFFYDGAKKSMYHVMKVASWWHVDRMMIFFDCIRCSCDN